MPRTRCTAFVLLLVALLWPTAALACSCAPFIGRGAANAIVVSGTIAEDIQDGITSPLWNHTRRLIPDRIWYGPEEPEFKLIDYSQRDNPSCPSFIGTPGQRVVAWLYPSGSGYYATGYCSIVHWHSDTRKAVEQSLQRSLTYYEDVDRRLRAAPNDADAWRERLVIARDLKDVHGRWRSLQQLVALTAAPGSDLLREAAEAASAAGDPAMAASLAGRALELSPGDEASRMTFRLATLRRSYDQGLVELTKKLDGLYWSDVDAQRLNLNFIAIEKFQIRKSTLDGGYVIMANFSGGVLRQSSLENMIIRDSRFESVLAREVKFGRTRFESSSLSDWRLDRGDFTEADFSQVSINGEITNSTFKKAKMRDVSFGLATLTDVDFTDASIRDVHFDGARLNGVDLGSLHGHRGATWTGAIVDCRTKLPADVDAAKAGIIYRAAQCDGQSNNRDFTGAAYRDVHDWSGLDLANARFAGVKFDTAIFRNADLRNADFSDVSVTYSHFQDTDLRGASFAKAVLDRPWFMNADLRGADLSDVVLKLEWYPGREKARYNSEFDRVKYDASTKWPTTFIDRDGLAHLFDPAEHGAILVKD